LRVSVSAQIIYRIVSYRISGYIKRL